MNWEPSVIPAFFLMSIEIKDFFVSICVDYSRVGEIKIIFQSVAILTMFRIFC